MSLSKHKRQIVLLVTLLIIGVVIFVFVLNKSDIRQIGSQLESISLGKIVILIIISLSIFLIYANNLKLLIKSFGSNIPILKSTVLKFIGDAVSYITPVVYIGGEFIMAYILKRDYKMPINKGMAAIVMEKMISLTITIFYFVIGVVLFVFYYTGNIKIIIPTIIVLFGSICFLIYFYLKTWRSQGLLYNLFKFLRLYKIKFISDGKVDIDKFDENLHQFFKYRPRYFLYSAAIVLIGTIASLLEYKLVLIFLGHNMSLVEILMLRVIFMAANAVPIPGALGTQEAAQAGYFSLLGLGASAGVAFILVIRFLQLINVSIGLVFLSLFGFKVFNPTAINNHYE